MRTARTALSPPDLIRNGFDWSGKTSRLPYIIVVAVTLFLSSLIPVTRNFTGANTAVFVALTMLFPIWFGHTRRRLRDVGWSGWLMWVAILPIVGLLLTIFLAFKPGDPLDEETRGPYSRLGFALALFCGAMMLSRAFWAPYWIPAGPMKPTLLVGDFVAVVPSYAPERGDVLVFKHPRHPYEVIKRLIGLPGDEVQMIGGIVHINKSPLPQINAGDFVETYAPQGSNRSLPRCSNTPEVIGEVCVKGLRLENSPEWRRYGILDIGTSRADDTEPVIVPEGQYYFLGDNRDNTLDSRQVYDDSIGLVPQDHVIGRVARVVFSARGDSLLQVWTWRPERFFLRVE